MLFLNIEKNYQNYYHKYQTIILEISWRENVRWDKCLLMKKIFQTLLILSH